jgi:hypothetical protein
MRFLLSLVVLFGSMAVSRADEPAIPNSLSGGRIANGWISLFDGKTTFGWETSGNVAIENGEMILGGDKETKVQTTSRFGPAILEIRYSPQHKTVNMGMFNFQDTSQGKTFYGTNGAGKLVSKPHGDVVEQVGNGGQAPSTLEPWPIVISVPKGEVIRIKSVELRPMKMTSLFNGKNLTGWHPYQGPDAKSKFSVTPEGTLHIENGKGDLQTDKQWADFLLQIECKTNAPALNSGVFFRCQANKYQQGYEAQIQNSFGPMRDYTIERYDPQTHALLAKDKVKYNSYDYGTGAIYRRIPARMQACKDKEWFTMTINSQGKHMGVWVNGLMVTDWTDNRPLNDNARNGCKLDAGNISLQGHDPTTNLDFRNIRIVDLSKP